MASRYTETTSFMLTTEQQQHLKVSASKRGLSLGEHIRSVLFPSVKTSACEPISMGKPTLDPWDYRNEKVTIHMTQARRKKLDERVKESGVNISKYVNNVLFPHG